MTEEININMKAAIPQSINLVLLELLSDYNKYITLEPKCSLDEYIAKAIRNIIYALHSQGAVLKIDRRVRDICESCDWFDGKCDFDGHCGLKGSLIIEEDVLEPLIKEE